jgi:trehalose 6-phosphate phosphatase
VLLDVDGVLAPIVAHPDDAHMPETTRRPLIEVAKRYGVVACVSGGAPRTRAGSSSLGSIAYLGSHGSEVLRPGAIKPEMDRELQAWTRRVQDFAHDAFGDELRQLRVRLEDKEAIARCTGAACPTRTTPRPAVREVAARAEKAGFTTHWGRKVLEIRPPVRIDKGAGIVSLLRDTDLAAALYVGDDVTDLDAFRGLDELVEKGRLGRAVKIGVRSDEDPAKAHPGTRTGWSRAHDGVRELLRALLG